MEKTMKNHIELATLRTKGYWFVDGLWEILSGVILALLGTVFFFHAQLPQGVQQPFSGSNLKDTILILGLAFGMAAISWLKQNITYRRTGYVAYRQEKFSARLQKYWKVIALISGVLFLAIIMLLVFPWARSGLFYGITWIPAMIGVGFSILMLAQAHQTGLNRFRILGYLGIALSVTLVILALIYDLNHALPAQLFASPLTGSMPPQVAQAMRTNMDFTYWLIAILCSGLGASLLASGVFTLIRYLRTNPALAEASDGR
jgi:predicted membrane channel-forming protein YqfA (hemolysin III family)